ncbi:DNA-binding transcriptional regulator, LysR family [Amphibacillus marinus]|uniref:DNA-binding transcriptional regulator, LysR family n=1 Tax=Amphibacillus marinus TaxID=872970 RepID=A0A1H8LPH1_9BACI|nr:LysR family transcriptional regulator [Amphibacillus marinus]SEO07000.1 DNA-binding transcriptional regulator, LysR family [Amphibacillus marinus]
MELRHLITFKTIVESGGFKKAADHLGYAQSSVTSHIKELERELGKPLFDRLGKKISLTETGEVFLPYARKMIALSSQSMEAIQSEHMPQGSLVIGVSESLLIYWLPTVISTFRKKYPMVDITVKALKYPNIANQLKEGEIDFAVLVELPDWHAPSLSLKQLGKEALLMVTAAHHPPQPNQTMLVTEYTCSWRPVIDTYMKAFYVDKLSQVELPSVAAIKQCVLAGLGIAMLPRFVIEEELAQGVLQLVTPDEPQEELGIYTAIHKDKWVSSKLQLFFELLETHANWRADNTKPIMCLKGQ